MNNAIESYPGQINDMCSQLCVLENKYWRSQWTIMLEHFDEVDLDDSANPVSKLTTDPEDERLQPYRGKGHDETAVSQQAAYLVLSEEDRSEGYLRPLRDSYKHKECGTVTTMSSPIAQTYARDPWFYNGTYCCGCSMHRPLSEFTWEPDGEEMDPHSWPNDVLNTVVELRKKEKGHG